MKTKKISTKKITAKVTTALDTIKESMTKANDHALNTTESVVTETIKNSNSFCNSYLDGNYANQIVEEHFEGKRDFSTLVWNIFSLEIWHKKFFL